MIVKKLSVNLRSLITEILIVGMEVNFLFYDVGETPVIKQVLVFLLIKKIVNFLINHFVNDLSLSSNNK